MNTFKDTYFHRLITWCLLFSDIASLFLSLGLAYYIRFRTDIFINMPYKLVTLEPRLEMNGQVIDPAEPERIYALTALALAPLWLFLFKFFGLYQEKRSASRIDNWVTISKAISIGTLIFLVGTFFYRFFTYSRIVMVLFWFLDIVITVLGRVVIRNIEARFREKGFDTRQVLLAGHSHIGDVLYNDFVSLPSLGYRFLGWVDDDPLPDRETLGTFEDIPEIVKKCGPLDIFIVEPNIERNKIMATIANTNGLPVRFNIVSGLFDMLTGKNVETISGFPVLKFGAGEFSPWKEKMKRGFDILVALFCLLLCLPLMLLIPLIIKITVGGKAVFRQKRIGINGVPFTIFKFSSMYPQTDPYAAAPISLRDERITPIGRFLRRTSLDELPQFFNVLKGEMSIVGPRPEMPFLVEKQNHWQRKRMSVKPGMTGVWQTMGRSDLPLQEHLEFDLYYIRNQSIFLDFQIMLKTFLVVVFGKGAY